MKSLELQLIQNKIYEVRGRQVMLDRDLAVMYQVETRVLNQAVKRNIDRFPEDFMFQLTNEEWKNLMSQNVISSWGGTRKMPFAFTEHGVVMLASLLRSDVAVKVSVQITRAFVAMRQLAVAAQTQSLQLSELQARLQLLEQTMESNLEAVNDLSEDTRREIDNIYAAIGQLSLRNDEERKRQAFNERKRVGFGNNG